MTRDEIAEINPEAIIGMAQRINLGPVVAYDVEKILNILSLDMKVDESDLQEGETIENIKYSMALEYFEYNILGAWMGEFTPVFITTNLE